QRFTNEANLIASLKHPYIVRIYEWGEVKGFHFIAMEYLDGGDLEARITVGMRVQEALDLARTVASVLDYAHSQGVIHRDIKPRNILFRGENELVLTDFGLAKHMEQDVELTATGMIVGSPAYMSPEQANGEVLDGRSDIYSLGVILYEMLTGNRPFEGKSAMAIMMQHITTPLPRLPAECAALQPLLDAMLAKKPEQRFDSANTLIQYLDRFRSPVGDSDSNVPVKLRVPLNLPLQGVPEALLNDLRAGIRVDLDNDRLILPSLPEVALKIRKELDNRSASATRLTKLIGTDPALSAQLLRIANSAYYAGTIPVKDLQRAVVKLGNDMVSHLVMMLVVVQLFHSRATKELQDKLREVWLHSVLVATLSEAIARKYTDLEPDVAMLAGLIHDVGVMPVLEWAVKIPHLYNSPPKLQRFVAVSHAEIGAAILSKWNYPEELITVVREHECPTPMTVPVPGYVEIVVLANRLASDIERIDEEEAWKNEEYSLGARQLDQSDIAELVDVGRRGAESLQSAIS
ncbi:MAG: HDOD domain-containing protein, partial [Gammaproteobacteria bacterium]|nr:HDOD domain-containing protein [Gammaproteobacteria bacterium]